MIKHSGVILPYLQEKRRQLLSQLPCRCSWCGDSDCFAIANICPDCFAHLPWNCHCCAHCALPMKQAGVCPCCRTNPSALRKLVAPLVYQPPIDQWVLAFKQGKALYHQPLFVKAMADSLGGLPELDLIIPVPLNWRKQLRRGFNQAKLLAAPLSAKLSVPMQTALKRHCGQMEQKQLTRARRLVNLEGQFYINPGDVSTIRGKRILLVDDVATTGTTLDQACKALLDGGALCVSAAVVARTPVRVAYD